jgi:AbrB family looped-hinge helix DNA binding protein
VIDRYTVNAVTISPKFQVVIPREVRKLLGLTAGQKVQVIALDGRIELIPIVPAKRLRGYLRGIDTRVERDDDR